MDGRDGRDGRDGLEGGTGEGAKVSIPVSVSSDGKVYVERYPHLDDDDEEEEETVISDWYV